jgi:hypothetical protein
MKKYNYRLCKQCKWVYFGVTKKYALSESRKFNEYFLSLNEKQQREYYSGKGNHIENYVNCYVCGNHWTNFRKAKNSEIPNGSTVSPIIYDKK